MYVYKHVLCSCAHVYKCTYVANLRRKGRKGGEKGRNPAPTPPLLSVSQAASSPDGLISSQRVHGIHTQPQESTVHYHPQCQGPLP